MNRQFEVISSQQVNQHLICSICREVFYNPIRATCGHTFCGTCLVRWIQQKKSCPLCRHQLERNYKYDKDILATKIVGDVQVKCLRCQQWNGTLALFKQHKKTQCKFVQQNNETPQNAIEIGDDDEDVTFSFIIDAQKILRQPNSPILVQVDEQSDEQEGLIQLHQKRQSKNNQNEINQGEINPYIINDSSNNIIIETQDNVLQEESDQQQQIIDGEQQYIVNEEQQQINMSKQNKSQKTDQEQDRLQNQQDIQITVDESENKQERINDMNQQLPQESEIEILEPSLRILNNREIKELKSTRKFRINILKNAINIVEPLIDSINEDLFYEFLTHMKSEMTKKLSDLNYINTLIG